MPEREAIVGSTVILGAGQAAAQAIVSLRQEGYEGRIVLIGDEPFLPYQRPALVQGISCRRTRARSPAAAPT